MISYHGSINGISRFFGVFFAMLLAEYQVPNQGLNPGHVSEKLGRGRHTTRHVELFQLDNETLLADTPGFSTLTVPEDIKREELSRLFPEFLDRLGDCRFATCMHKNEPDCAVKHALANGEVAQSRYDNYLAFLEEVIQQERSF